MGTVDDSVDRHPWDGVAGPRFVDVLLRAVITSDPIGINDGYLYQSNWAIEDIKSGEKSLLARLVREGFLKVICRADHFADMPGRMEQIVGTHTRLRSRGDYASIHSAAGQFGKVVEESAALVRWPAVDIGYGFYLLAVAAHRLLRETGAVEAFDLDGVPKAVVLSALTGIIQSFHDKPVSIRGRYEEEVIPSVLREFRLRSDLHAPTTRLLMGLANEFYHYNFASLLAGETNSTHGFDEIAVETRASPRFRTLLQQGVLPAGLADEDIRRAPQLNIPGSTDGIDIDSIIDFVRIGKGAYDAKQQFLEAERRFFAGDSLAAGELGRSVAALNNAIYTLRYQDRDVARAESFQRPLRIVQTYWQPLNAIGQKLLGCIGIDISEGIDVDAAVDLTLGHAQVESYPVIRKIGKFTSQKITVARATDRERTTALNLVSLRPDKCQAFRAETERTLNRFGTSFAIDPGELNQKPNWAG